MKLFITGTFRAGTTLTAQMLNQHPDLHVTYDSVHFMRFAYQRYGRNALTPDAAHRLGEAMNSRLNARFRRGFDIAQYRARVAALDRVTYAAVYDIIMRLYVGHENWGEKTVLQWRNAPDILELFDDIHIIHCMRDPRDVLSSWQRETIAPGVDYLDAIGNCFDSMKYAAENSRRFPGRYHVLKYEDLALSPEVAARGLCESLNIRFHGQMLEADRFRNKVTQEKWAPNTAFGDDIEGISANPVSRWRKHLDKDDLVLCELANRTHMEVFGYELSGQLERLDIHDVYRAMAKLQQSPLAFSGILNVIQRGEGVQRYPLDDADPTTWEQDVAKL